MKKSICFALAVAIVISLCTLPILAVSTSIDTITFDGVANCEPLDAYGCSTQTNTDVKFKIDSTDSVIVSISNGDTAFESAGKILVYDEGAYAGMRAVFIPNDTSNMTPIRIHLDENALYANTSNIKMQTVSANVTERQFESLFKKGIETKQNMVNSNTYVRGDYLAELIEADLGIDSNVMPISISNNDSVPLSTTSSYTQPSKTNLLNFLNALRNSPSAWISCSAYNIPSAYLTTSEFIAYSNLTGESPYICAKSTNYSTGYYYTRIGVMNLVYNAYNNSSGSGTKEHRMDATIATGLCLEYNASTGQARLFVDNYSPYFYNVQPAVGMTSGNENNLFVHQEYAAVMNKKPTVSVNILTLLSIHPKYGWVATLFSALEIDTQHTSLSSGACEYPNSVSEQITVHGGVIRQMSLNTRTSYLADIGDHFYMAAEEKYTTTSSTVTYQWRANAALNTDQIS